MDTLYRILIISFSTVLPLSLHINLSSAPHSLFSILTPHSQAWFDCRSLWSSSEPPSLGRSWRAPSPPTMLNVQFNHYITKTLSKCLIVKVSYLTKVIEKKNVTIRMPFVKVLLGNTVSLNQCAKKRVHFGNMLISMVIMKQWQTINKQNEAIVKKSKKQYKFRKKNFLTKLQLFHRQQITAKKC